jgi:hypothetical protein
MSTVQGASHFRDVIDSDNRILGKGDGAISDAGAKAADDAEKLKTDGSGDGALLGDTVSYMLDLTKKATTKAEKAKLQGILDGVATAYSQIQDTPGAFDPKRDLSPQDKIDQVNEELEKQFRNDNPSYFPTDAAPQVHLSK